MGQVVVVAVPVHQRQQMLVETVETTEQVEVAVVAHRDLTLAQAGMEEMELLLLQLIFNL